jgi:haloalkane dehalogenase
MTPTNLAAAPDTDAARAIDGRGAALGLRIRSTMIAGARTTFVDEGEGPVVLLLHGAPVTSLGFVRVIRELRTTHRVIAPDLPGFGGSEAPSGFGSTLDEYATFVVQLCSVLDLKDVVMYVNDSSGCIGIAAATRFAPGTLKGIVVASTVPIPLVGTAWFVGLVLRYVVTSRLMRWLNRRFNLLPWLVATVAPWLAPFSKAERAALTREFDTVEKRERALDLFEQMAVDKAFMRSTANRASEQLAALPTLILYGQLDPMRLIGGVSRFRALFPTSHVVIIPLEEHFPILSSGAKVASAMRDWMNRLPENTPQ